MAGQFDEKSRKLLKAWCLDFTGQDFDPYDPSSEFTRALSTAMKYCKISSPVYLRDLIRNNPQSTLLQRCKKSLQTIFEIKKKLLELRTMLGRIEAPSGSIRVYLNQDPRDYIQGICNLIAGHDLPDPVFPDPDFHGPEVKSPEAIVALLHQMSQSCANIDILEKLLYESGLSRLPLPREYCDPYAIDPLKTCRTGQTRKPCSHRGPP